MKIFSLKKDLALIAQSVARWVCNPRVVGSNPAFHSLIYNMENCLFKYTNFSRYTFIHIYINIHIDIHIHINIHIYINIQHIH